MSNSSPLFFLFSFVSTIIPKVIRTVAIVDVSMSWGLWMTLLLDYLFSSQREANATSTRHLYQTPLPDTSTRHSSYVTAWVRCCILYFLPSYLLSIVHWMQLSSTQTHVTSCCRTPIITVSCLHTHSLRGTQNLVRTLTITRSSLVSSHPPHHL